MGELPSDILLVNAMPSSPNGVIYQFRETAGRSSAVKTNELLKNEDAGMPGEKKNLKISRVNVLGEEMQQIGAEFTISALETVFIKLSWDE